MTRAPLPIDDVLPRIAAALIKAPNLVIAAPPGAGKTTRVPISLIDAPWRGTGKILMLEPRRIAARAAADRLAAERNEKPGRTVGYRIRGEGKPGSVIEVVTEGILTAMLQDDPELSGIAAVIFDEAHERSIHSDLGLALALDVQDALRPDLRLIVMSATLDTAAYAALLGQADVIESPGRAFPVDTRMLNRPWRTPGAGRRGFETALARLIMEATEASEGDILAFLPGAPEIERTLAAVGPLPGNAAPLALHGSLPFARQAEVLRPDHEHTRRVILATAIAETSLTVPGVRVVIDGGLARRARTDPATGLSRLVTGPVSRAQADQRRGRAGRLGPGICYRMWTKGEDGALPAFQPPEILETDIAPLVLQLALWGAREPAALRFLDPPAAAAVSAARDLLTALGALDQEARITAHGRALAQRPLHPRLAHMLTAARADGFEHEAGLVAAILSDRDPLTGTQRRHADFAARIEAVLAPDQRTARGTADRIRAEARRLTGTLPDRSRTTDHAGLLLARAYPDRIARARPDVSSDQATRRYLLANGRGAVLDAQDPLARHEWLVPTDLEDGKEARIRTAAPVTEADVRALFTNRIIEETTAKWSPRSERVEARIRERLDALVLSERPWADAPPEAIAAALTEGIRAKGIAALPWSKAGRLLQARLTWLADQAPGLGLPDCSDAALAASLETWLTPHLGGMSRIGDLARLDLGALLRARLDWPAKQTLDRAAPAAFATPLGHRAAIDYGRAQPAIALKVQELYGQTDHPSVGDPPVPLMIELLSPAGRPVQTTSDLPGFWASSYRDVAKDMRARYPKHHWPDDPASAAPTNRTRRR